MSGSDASKRLRPDDDRGDSADADLVCRSTLDSLFSDWQKEVVHNVEKSTESLFKRYDAGMQKRFDKIESSQLSLNRRMDETENDPQGY